MATIKNSQLMPDTDGTYGAPMGRSNLYPIVNGTEYKPTKGTFTRRVHLNSGGYDRGGAYWGHDMDSPLFVEYTPDLAYIRFFRKHWVKEGFSGHWVED